MFISDYSRGDYAALPADDTNLEEEFVWDDYVYVSLNDDVFRTQTAQGQYAVFQFKNKGTDNTTPLKATCVVKSSLAPSESTVYLQIYNRTLLTWQTLRSNGTANADTKFTLEANVVFGLSDYADENYWYSFRVYQLIV